MTPLSEWRSLVAGATRAEFVAAHAHPFLVLSLAKPLSPVSGGTQGLTIDRMILPGSGDAQSPIGLANYLVAAVKSSEASRAKEVTIGCSSHCDVQINDTSVSKLHAYLVHKADGWHVSDASSLAGTRVNDEDPGASPLQSGDRISIGLVDLVFLLPDELFVLVQQLSKTPVSNQTAVS